MAHLASLASVLATIMEKHQPLGILPVPWHVGQVSPAGAAFMDPYGGKCISVFTFSIPGVGPSGVDKTNTLPARGKVKKKSRPTAENVPIKARFYDRF